MTTVRVVGPLRHLYGYERRSCSIDTTRTYAEFFDEELEKYADIVILVNDRVVQPDDLMENTEEITLLPLASGG